MALKIKETKDEIIKQHGNIAMVAKSFNVSRTTVYNFMEKHPDVKDVLSDEREKMLDNVESSLYNQALEGNTTAMIFFLKTQGKGRGYVERQEIAGTKDDPLTLRVVFESESKEAHD
jgi:hypothetical protein